MPTRVPIILRRRGKYRFPGESCAVHRTHGHIIGDVDIASAAELIACGAADLFVGKIPSSAEFLAQDHPQSRAMRSLQRRQQEEALVRHFISQP